MKKSIKLLVSVAIMSLLLAGCGQKEYYTAMEKQNTLIYQMNLQHEHEKMLDEQRHEEHMARLFQTSLSAAAQTKDKTDDVLIPILLMNMENQRTMAKALAAGKERQMALQPIKAPETFGEAVKNSTGAILGIGAIWAGIAQSNNLTDVAIAGMAGAGVHNTISGHDNKVVNDSYKSASQNTTTGNNNTMTGGNIDASCPTGDCSEVPEEGEGGEAGTQGTSGDEASTGILQCIQNPPGGYGSNSLPLYSSGCSCKSHFAGKC